jgi:hypothetical protein
MRAEALGRWEPVVKSLISTIETISGYHAALCQQA